MYSVKWRVWGSCRLLSPRYKDTRVVSVDKVTQLSIHQTKRRLEAVPSRLGQTTKVRARNTVRFQKAPVCCPVEMAPAAASPGNDDSGELSGCVTCQCASFEFHTVTFSGSLLEAVHPGSAQLIISCVGTE